MGGALFLREVYRQTGLSERWGQSIAVGRRLSHVDHSLVDWLRQRAPAPHGADAQSSAGRAR